MMIRWRPDICRKKLTNDSHPKDSRTFAYDFSIPPEGIDLESTVDSFASHLIKKAIQMSEGNISLAAKLLRVPRGTLRYKLEKLS